MWFALALVYGSLCVLTARRQAIPATQERLNELAEESVRIAMDLQGSPNRAGWMLSDNECGWPLPLIEQWDSQVYECYPGQQPSAVPRRYPPSLNVAWAPMWQLQFAMDDPSKMRVINIYWARILASIMFLQTAALCVMASFLMIRRLWRRKHVT